VTWTLVLDPETLQEALKLAKGCYQRALLLGNESLSGSTLRGKAASYSGSYARSRQALLDRLSSKGVHWSEEKGPRGKRILVLGRAPTPTLWDRLLLGGSVQ